MRSGRTQKRRESDTESPLTYLIVGLETGLAWPKTRTEVPYGGDTFTLLPAGDDTLPCVVLPFAPRAEYDSAIERVRRFLSALSWIHGALIREEEVTTGGRVEAIRRGRTAEVLIDRFPVDHLPQPNDSDARRALALFRQGLSLNGIPFQFLSFANILSVRLHKGVQQVAWINRTLSRLDDWEASKRLADLQTSQPDVGKYLYASGRCAVAHASRKPAIDPDDTADEKRLRRDLPLMRALAERFIEDELGIQTQRTIWREHRYELVGFGSLLGTSLSAKVKARESVKASALPSPPRLSVRLRGFVPFPTFEGLVATFTDAANGAISMLCTTASGLLAIGFVLDFANERLLFDPLYRIGVKDDRSISAIDAMLDRLKLQRGLLYNAQLEVWNQETDALLSRTNPFIPQNIDSAASIRNIDEVTARLQAERARRSSVVPSKLSAVK